jgi:hypothetical protein
MKHFYKNPWAPILTVPTIGLLFFFLIPWLSLTFVNSRSVSVVVVALGIFLVPWLLARLHEALFLYILAIWIFFGAVNVWTMPKEWEGNPKLAFVSHFLPGILLSLILSMVLVIFLRRKKQMNAASQ